MKHKHHDIIAEWIKDTSRKVYIKMTNSEKFEYCHNPSFQSDWEYCFEEDLPVETTMTDDELVVLYTNYLLRRSELRDCANAIIQRHEQDMRLKREQESKEAEIMEENALHIIQAGQAYGGVLRGRS